MKNWKEWLAKLPVRAIIFVAGFVIVERLCHKATDGFSMRRIYCPFQVEERFYPLLRSSAFAKFSLNPFAIWTQEVKASFSCPPTSATFSSFSS